MCFSSASSDGECEGRLTEEFTAGSRRSPEPAVAVRSTGYIEPCSLWAFHRLHPSPIGCGHQRMNIIMTNPTCYPGFPWPGKRKRIRTSRGSTGKTNGKQPISTKSGSPVQESQRGRLIAPRIRQARPDKREYGGAAWRDSDSAGHVGGADALLHTRFPCYQSPCAGPLLRRPHCTSVALPIAAWLLQETLQRGWKGNRERTKGEGGHRTAGY